MGGCDSIRVRASRVKRLETRTKNSGKFELLAIVRKVRVLPWHDMTDVDAPVLLWGETIGKHAGIEIIHVLVDSEVGWYECIEKEQIQIF